MKRRENLKSKVVITLDEVEIQQAIREYVSRMIPIPNARVRIWKNDTFQAEIESETK